MKVDDCIEQENSSNENEKILRWLRSLEKIVQDIRRIIGRTNRNYWKVGIGCKG